MTKRILGPRAILGLSAVALCLSSPGGLKAQLQSAPSKLSASDNISPGKYTTESGWGNLLISKGAAGRTAFDIQSTTGEDVCHVQGEIVNQEGSATDRENGDVCKIKFAKTDKGINVMVDTPAECRGFCGANGNFKGLYLTIPIGCHADDIDKTRSSFKSSYLKKDYKVALSTLQPVLDNCSTILTFVDLGDVRNDVAITQYKNGLYGECLKTLEPYAADAKRKDAEVANDWPPAQADDYLKIIRAARTNIRLCSK